MRRRGRWRRWAKWTGVGACAVILAVWGVSLFWGVGVRWAERCIYLEDGCFVVSNINFHLMDPVPPVAVWDTTYSDRTFGFERPTYELVYECYTLFVPFWTLLLLAGVPTALLFILDRRRIVPGHCQQCGYDLRTMTGGRCPECGTSTGRETPSAGIDSPAEMQTGRLK